MSIRTVRDRNHTYVPARLFWGTWAAVILFDVLAVFALLAFGVAETWWPDTTPGEQLASTWMLVGLVPGVLLTVGAAVASAEYRPDSHRDFPGTEPLVQADEPLVNRKARGGWWGAA